MAEFNVGYEIEFGAPEPWNRDNLIFGLREVLGPDVTRPDRMRGRDYSKWNVVNDSSVQFRTMMHPHEIVSPVMPKDEGLAKLEVLFDWLKDKGMKTNKTCGFHFNVSFLDPEYQNGFDPIKLLFHFDERGYLAKWNRTNNRYCQSIKSSLINYIVQGNFHGHYDSNRYRNRPVKAFKSGNDFRYDLSSGIVNKYQTINFIKLSRGYLEFRLMGGIQYHTKKKLIRETISHIFESMAQSLDSEYMKDQYQAFLRPYLDSYNGLSKTRLVEEKILLDRQIQTLSNRSREIDQFFTEIDQ